jgi:type I restriction enzyme M protein
MAKKQKTTDTLNLESILFNCREYLRSNASLNDKRDLLLTLVFLRFIGEKFENTQEVMRQECLNEGITDEEVIKAYLKSPDRYEGIAFVPEKARWSMIIDQPASKLNATLDDAIQELENSGDTLKGCIRIGLFT